MTGYHYISFLFFISFISLKKQNITQQKFDILIPAFISMNGCIFELNFKRNSAVSDTFSDQALLSAFMTLYQL